MPDTKISAMTPATVMNDTDIFPIVQGGANFSATKAQLLTAPAGGQIELADLTGDALTLNPAAAPGSAQLTSGSLIHIQAGPSTLIVMDGIAQTISIQAPSHLSLGSFPDTCFVSWQDPTGSNWVGGTPFDLAVAVQRIATAVNILLGGTGIP